MKLQYRFKENYRLQYEIQLYKDGELEKTYKVWLDEINDENDKLEEQGYTLGYTRKEIRNQKSARTL